MPQPAGARLGLGVPLPWREGYGQDAAFTTAVIGKILADHLAGA